MLSPDFPPSTTGFTTLAKIPTPSSARRSSPLVAVRDPPRERLPAFRLSADRDCEKETENYNQVSVWYDDLTYQHILCALQSTVQVDRCRALALYLLMITGPVDLIPLSMF